MDSSSISGTIGLISKVINLGKKATNLQYEEALIAARELLVSQGAENLELKEKLLNLQKKVDLENSYHLSTGVYWHKTDTDLYQPFCPPCYASGRVMPLQPLYAQREKSQTKWICPDKNCKADFNPWGHKEPSRSGTVRRKIL